MGIKTQTSVDAVTDVVCDVCNTSTRIPGYDTMRCASS
jgi:hypothetical protein